MLASPPASSTLAPIVKLLSKTDEKRRVTVSLSKISVTSTVLHVTVTVSGRARIRVSGSGVKVTIRNAAQAGSYTLVVPLSSKARTIRSRRRKLKLTARVTATPPSGKAAVAKISKTLGK